MLAYLDPRLVLKLAQAPKGESDTSREVIADALFGTALSNQL